MPFLTREDGKHFIVPSYRYALRATSKSNLKKEILLLSSAYGEFITLQRNAGNLYEIAFSKEAGYLLGESIWEHFNRPAEMIYCEEIPDTQEALLVIVKGGSVYLDGVFPLDNIAEELIIFKTQKNNFDIYIYGNVPISKEADENKIYFESTSVKSFAVLTKPVFANLHTRKNYQLQFVDTVLKAQGIGTFPTKQAVAVLVAAGLIWMAINYFSTSNQETTPNTTQKVVNPYAGLITELSSPNPVAILNEIQKNVLFLQVVPGWQVARATFSANTLTASAQPSTIYNTQLLYTWAQQYHAAVDLQSGQPIISLTLTLPNRQGPTTIMRLPEVIAQTMDRVMGNSSGNTVRLTSITPKQEYKEAVLVINFKQIYPLSLTTIAEQLQSLPLTVIEANVNISQGMESGTITLKALGN